MKTPKWRWVPGKHGEKKILTVGGRGMQTDSAIYDLRGSVALNYYHRNQDDKLNRRLAHREIRNLFRRYGENLIIIDQYNTVYNTQVYFRYENEPPAALVQQWMAQIKCVMNEC